MGEIDSTLRNRIDSENYWKSCERLENFVVTSFGTAQKRNGTTQYLDVTDLLDISPAPTVVRWEEQTISSPTSIDIESVGILIIDQDLNIQVLTDTPGTWVTLSLLDYTLAQVKEIKFSAVENDIYLFHPNVRTKKIEYDGVTFTLSDFFFAREPTEDIGTADYNSLRIYASQNATTGVAIIFVETATAFGTTQAEIDRWVGGTIVGPGPDKVATLASGRIDSVLISGGNTEFTVATQHPFLDQAAYGSYKGTDFNIRQPVFNDSIGFAGEGVFYKNRIWMTAHPRLPLSVFGSNLGTANNFDVGIGSPADAIVYKMKSETTGSILHLNVGKHLEVFTQNTEGSVLETNAGLTASTFDIKQQTSYGISSICSPINFQNYTFFAGKTLKSIYLFEESGGVEQAYTTVSMAAFASHLIKSPKKLAAFYSKDQSSILLAVLNSDHTLAIFNFNEKNKVEAWSPLTFSEDIELIDLDSSQGELYVLVKYVKTSKYYLEKLQYTDEVPVDSAKFITLIVGTTEITGLSDFEGYSVGVSDGTVHLGNYIVSGGKVTLSKTVSELFTGYVGLIFTPILKPLSAVQAPDLLYGRKSLDAVYIDYDESLDVRVDDVLMTYQSFSEIQAGEKLTPKSGTFEYRPQKGWQQYQDFTITQNNPVRMHILSFGYRLTESGA